MLIFVDNRQQASRSATGHIISSPNMYNRSSSCSERYNLNLPLFPFAFSAQSPRTKCYRTREVPVSRTHIQRERNSTLQQNIGHSTFQDTPSYPSPMSITREKQASTYLKRTPDPVSFQVSEFPLFKIPSYKHLTSPTSIYTFPSARLRQSQRLVAYISVVGKG